MRVSMIVLVCWATSVWAGDARLNLSPSPQAFSAKFVEIRTLPGFQQPLVSHGQLSFSRSQGVIWEVTSPYHYVFKMGPAGVEEEMPDGSIRHLDPQQAPWLGMMQQVFTGALSGDTSELRRYFNVQVTALKDSQRIELNPKPGPVAKAIKHISVVQAGTPQSLRIDEVSGGRIEIRFLDVHTAAETP